jgi:hypothetical protein
MKTSSLKLALVALAAITAAGTANADHRRGKGFFANTVRLEQTGRGNGAAQSQTGAANASAIAQVGISNTGTTSQTGVNNTATIDQRGQGNTAGITQTGSGNNGCIVQAGTGLNAQMTQTGGSSMGVIQTNKRSEVVANEICSAKEGSVFGLIKTMKINVIKD